MSSAAPVAPFSFNLFASREVAARATAYWWLSLVSGFCWILLSAIVFRFDYASVTAVAVLFGCVAIAAGVMEIGFAAASKGAWKLLHGLLGVVLAAIGVVAFFTPGGTFVGLAAVFSFYFVLAGAWDISIALWTRHEHSAWWLQALSGVVELGLGFWAAGYWNRSALLLIAFVGAMALTRGVVQIVFAFRLHELHRALEAGDAAPASAATQA